MHRTTADLAQAERQRDEYDDLLLRKTAEFDNYRKRAERERQTLVGSGGGRASSKSCFRSWTTSSGRSSAEPGADGAEAYRKGVELIHRQLQEILRKRGVRPIEALGADFDPHYPPGGRHTNPPRTARRRDRRRVPPRLHARRPAAAAVDGESGERAEPA